jgi:hypothetical protein
MASGTYQTTARDARDGPQLPDRRSPASTARTPPPIRQHHGSAEIRHACIRRRITYDAVGQRQGAGATRGDGTSVAICVARHAVHVSSADQVPQVLGRIVTARIDISLAKTGLSLLGCIDAPKPIVRASDDNGVASTRTCTPVTFGGSSSTSSEVACSVAVWLLWASRPMGRIKARRIGRPARSSNIDVSYQLTGALVDHSSAARSIRSGRLFLTFPTSGDTSHASMAPA